jgi:hypothetical protein
MQVLVDAVDDEGATCRTWADAPEIDGNLFIDEGFEALAPGDLVMVEVEAPSPSCAAIQQSQPSVQPHPRQRVTTSAQSPWVMRPSSNAR